MRAVKRPFSLTLIGWLFVAVGCVGLARHGWEVIDGRQPLDGDAAWALGSGLVALLGGVLLLRRVACARWVIIAWLLFHVLLRLAHDAAGLAVHVALLLVIGGLLLRPAATAWLRGRDD